MMYRLRGVVRHGAYVGIVEVIDLAASRRAGECVYRELYQYPHVWQAHESARILNGAYLATQRERIGTAYLIGTGPTRRDWWIGSRLHYWRVVTDDGERWHGRNAGDGLAVRLRRCKSQGRHARAVRGIARRVQLARHARGAVD